MPSHSRMIPTRRPVSGSRGEDEDGAFLPSYHRDDSKQTPLQRKWTRCKRDCHPSRCTWKRVVTWLLGLWMASLVYLKLMRIVIRPLQLDLPKDAPKAVCPYLDPHVIEVRRNGLQNGLKIGLVTFFEHMDPNLVRLSMKNKQAYAKLHGYDVIQADDEIDRTRQSPWSKMPILKRHLDDYDYLVWLDADALVSNFYVRIEDIVDAEHDLFYAKDELGINSGIFVIRNSDFSRWYLDELWDQEWLVTDYNFRSTHEQRAIHYLHGENTAKAWETEFRKPPHPKTDLVNERTQIVDHCALNSNVCEEFWTGLILYRRTPFPGYYCDNVFKPGNFIIHLAGKQPGWYKKQLFEEFATKIMRDNSDIFEE